MKMNMPIKMQTRRKKCAIGKHSSNENEHNHVAHVTEYQSSGTVEPIQKKKLSLLAQRLQY